MNIERLREALIAHEKKVVDMVLSCQKDPEDVHLTSTEVLESRYALLAALKDTTNVPPKRGKHTNTSDGYCEICRPAKK